MCCKLTGSEGGRRLGIRWVHRAAERRHAGMGGSKHLGASRAGWAVMKAATASSGAASIRAGANL